MAEKIRGAVQKRLIIMTDLVQATTPDGIVAATKNLAAVNGDLVAALKRLRHMTANAPHATARSRMLVAHITDAEQRYEQVAPDIVDAVARNPRDERVTRQNAALVEQASAAAQSMQDQATGLERCVGAIRL